MACHVLKTTRDLLSLHKSNEVRILTTIYGCASDMYLVVFVFYLTKRRIGGGKKGVTNWQVVRSNPIKGYTALSRHKKMEEKVAL